MKILTSSKWTVRNFLELSAVTIQGRSCIVVFTKPPKDESWPRIRVNAE